MSIKLSYFGDILSKQTKIGAALIGGLLIASITSLPELVTCISAVFFDNPTLAFGDIVGSNMFNIFVLAIYNLYFFKLDFFQNISKKYIFECIILVIDYIFIYLSFKGIFNALTTIILFIMYVIYLISILKTKKEDNDIIYEKDKYIGIKFILTAIIMTFLSISLTYQADKIAYLYPKFSSSSIGAILLGISTSLPEVVTTFALLKLKSYNMAISNMLGSNIFNFLVLGLADLFVKNNHIYNYADYYSMFYVFGGIILTILFLTVLNKKFNNKIYCIFISILMIIIYFRVWYLQFV
jgi:cation:H+ antiporter